MESVTPISTGPRSAWEITFPQAVLWALIGCTAAFAITIVTERTRGTLLRLRIAPISRGHILTGKALSCFLTAVSVCLLLLLIGKFIFGVRTPNLIALGLAIACTAICFVGLMMLMSVMGKTEQAVAGAGWAILLVFSMTGGGMVPLMVMPGWMISISHISPVKWGIFALEGAIWRGFSPQEMALPLSILTLIGLTTFLMGVVIFRKTT
jgi:ABC-2 type transport system permease protein